MDGREGGREGETDRDSKWMGGREGGRDRDSKWMGGRERPGQ